MHQGFDSSGQGLGPKGQGLLPLPQTHLHRHTGENEVWMTPEPRGRRKRRGGRRMGRGRVKREEMLGVGGVGVSWGEAKCVIIEVRTSVPCV